MPATGFLGICLKMKSCKTSLIEVLQLLLYNQVHDE